MTITLQNVCMPMLFNWPSLGRQHGHVAGPQGSEKGRSIPAAPARQQSAMKTAPAALVAVSLMLSACGREGDGGTAPRASPGRAEERAAARVEIVPLETAQRWMTYQYLSNDPERAPSMVESFVRAGGHTANPETNALGVIGVFLGRVGAANPAQLDAWTAAAEGLSPEAASVIAYGVWDADPEGAPPRLRRIAGAMDERDAAPLLELIGREPPALADMVLTHAGVLDYWWAAFMATGDTAWVDLVMGVIPPPGMSMEESGLDNPAQLAIAKAAVWSLASNGAQHPRVLAHLKDRLAAAGGDWPTIAEVVRVAEEAAQENPPALPED